jgi:hypothetical protein
MTVALGRIVSSRRCGPRAASRGWLIGARFVAIAFVLISPGCTSSESSQATRIEALPGAGASAIPAGWPEGAPYITGIVTELSRDTVRIEERPAMKGGSPKAVLTIDDAMMLRGIAGAEKPRLRVGQRVSAWVGPRVMESYPIRAKALAIQIVEDTTTTKKR